MIFTLLRNCGAPTKLKIQFQTETHANVFYKFLNQMRFSSIFRSPISSSASSPKRFYNKFSVTLLETNKCLNHFNQILSHAITGGFFNDPFISSKLLYYSLPYSHDLTFSRTLFFQARDPNIYAWNFMFRAYSDSSSPAESITLYNLMRRTGVVPDHHTFPCVLKACGHLSLSQKGQELHSLTLKSGLLLDVFVQNALISMYSLCRMVAMARRVFEMIPLLVRDVVSWNSIIHGYIHCGRFKVALSVFGKLIGDTSLRPNDVTLATAITACGRTGSLALGRKLHGLIMGNGVFMDFFLGSSLIDMYAKCGQIEDARKVFDRIPNRNIVCWTSMIAGYAQLDLFNEAINLFREMQVGGCTAESSTVACVISACGHSGALDQGRWVHTHCEKNGIEMNLSVRNALIDMYSKCGDFEKALKIFCELSQRDVFSWTSMISGLAMNGESDKALQLFSQMEISSEVRPNEVTFLGVLSACSHGGYVDKGFSYFKEMAQLYYITPRIEHYGCMVDLLGRANLLAEAEEFIRTMPIQPDIVIWRSLLFACTTHGNIELAEFAANQIEELDPNRCGSRVLLSNVYASASRWSDVKRVRKGMVLQGIRKQPACSYVEINGLIEEFLVKDFSHSQVDVIYDTVIGINNVLQFEEFELDILNYQ